MKQITTVLLFLTRVTLLVSLDQHRYYLIKQAKTWLDAQTYCRAVYDDLATINSDADMARLQTEAQKNKFTSSAWFGIYKDSHGWRWSYENESLGTETFWSPTQPDNLGDKQECVRVVTDWCWYDRECSDLHPFVCYDDRNTGSDRYIYINTPLSWFEAQSYCRLNHTDLASMRNATEKSLICGLIPSTIIWIGLSRITWKWLDQTNPTNIPWMPGQPDNLIAFKDCGYLSNFQAADDLCTVLRPFFCHRIIRGKKHFVRFKFQSDRNMNDPALKEALLIKIRQNMMEHGLEQNITLKWREKPGREVFQKIKDYEILNVGDTVKICGK